MSTTADWQIIGGHLRYVISRAEVGWAGPTEEAGRARVRGIAEALVALATGSPLPDGDDVDWLIADFEAIPYLGTLRLDDELARAARFRFTKYFAAAVKARREASDARIAAANLAEEVPS